MSENDLGDYIHKLRKQKGLTLKQLGEKINFSDAYISMVEKGNRTKPSIEFLLKIAKELDTPNGNLLMLAGYIDDPFDKEAFELKKTIELPNPDKDLRYLLTVKEKVFYNGKLLSEDDKQNGLTILDTLYGKKK